MDFALRKARLLAGLWRERNGAVADSMRCYGEKYVRSYGVSLPTVRVAARAEGCDHAFAHDLYVQPVRELRLAALHVADPAQVGSDEFDFWAAGILNSEVAEEAAFALLGRIGALDELFRAWIGRPNPLLRYTALLAAARAPQPDFLAPAFEAVERSERDGAEAPVRRMMTHGATVLAVALGRRSEADRHRVQAAFAAMTPSPAAECLREEVAWQLEG